VLSHHGVNLLPVFPGFEIDAQDKERSAVVKHVFLSPIGHIGDHLGFCVVASRISRAVIGKQIPFRLPWAGDFEASRLEPVVFGRPLSSVAGLSYLDERKRRMPVRDRLTRLIPIVAVVITPISVIAVVWHGSPCGRMIAPLRYRDQRIATSGRLAARGQLRHASSRGDGQPRA
jgi:hypothetical protein